MFNDDEMDRIISYLKDNPDIQNLGILLLFVTGIRVGELVALKYSDFEGNAIRIRRTEVIYKDDTGKNVYTIKEFPKTKAGVRTAIIPPDYIWIVNQLMSLNDNEYVFYKKGKRLSTHSIRRRLERICKKLEIYPKSPHKIRKTYGTILLDNNVDNRLVTELMGHTNISITENYYHRNRRSLDAKTERIKEIPEFAAK